MRVDISRLIWPLLRTYRRRHIARTRVCIRSVVKPRDLLRRETRDLRSQRIGDDALAGRIECCTD